MTPLQKIRSALVVGGIFGLTLQEGRGQVQFAELLLPGKRLLVCLYSIQELTRILDTTPAPSARRRSELALKALAVPLRRVRAYGHSGMTWTAGLGHLRRLFSSAEKIFPGLRAQKKK